MNKHNRWLVPLAVAMVVGAIDQATKWWVVRTLGPETMTNFIPLVGDSIRIAYSHNTGVAFSLFQGHPEWLIATALLIVAGAIVFYHTRLPNHRPGIQVIMGLIMGGAFGNIIDRVRLGYVVDFIQVGWWPIFNVADSAITTGAALLMLHFAREELAQRQARRDRQALPHR
ncbi:MAG: signal peptidase II [Oscillochloridaceae bacterium]|nr:signal peptidase II [Chloroflexaceae bacterium]MDW8391676.1 signal peptidase II [Oscillochloridaceae bacterium]